MRNSSVYYLLVMSMLTFFTAGCVRLSNEYPNVVMYTFNVTNVQTDGSEQDLPPVILVNGKALTPYDEIFIVCRTDEFSYTTDYYHQFASTPLKLITESTQSWLSQRIQSEPADADLPSQGSALEITCSLVSLYGDYRDPAAPKAVLSLEYSVKDITKKNRPIIFKKQYSRAENIELRDPDQLLSAWNAELISILTEFRGDLREQLVR